MTQNLFTKPNLLVDEAIKVIEMMNFQSVKYEAEDGDDNAGNQKSAQRDKEDSA